MNIKNDYKIGILAYGSLINNPGDEISSLEIKRIECTTPFRIEFARTSISRKGAPTLIPSEKLDIGKRVNGIIIVLKDETQLDTAKSIIWRREIHKVGDKREYLKPEKITNNSVLVEELVDFMGVETVLYTSIGSNIDEEITPKLLAKLAIDSFVKDNKSGKDGISYLLDAKKNGIITELSLDYEKEILLATGTTDLQEAKEYLKDNN